MAARHIEAIQQGLDPADTKLKQRLYAKLGSGAVSQKIAGRFRALARAKLQAVTHPCVVVGEALLVHDEHTGGSPTC